MKKSALFVVGLLAIAGLAPMAQAHEPALVHTTAAIVPHLSLTVSPMDFGKLSPKGNGGSVTLNSNGSKTYDNVVQMDGTVPTLGTVTVSGYNAASFVITWPKTIDLINTTDATKFMTLSLINLDGDFNGTKNDNLSSGIKAYTMGGKLTVDKKQTDGSYEANIEITVEYT